MNIRVHTRITNEMNAMGRKMQFTITNFVPQYVGFTKFDVCPSGGGIAGTRIESAML
jgi:hypothetical protein